MACRVLHSIHGCGRPLRMPVPGPHDSPKKARAIAAAAKSVSDMPEASPGCPVNVGDISLTDWSEYRGLVDIVVGGPPCQGFSVAGLRRSLDDPPRGIVAFLRGGHPCHTPRLGIHGKRPRMVVDQGQRLRILPGSACGSGRRTPSTRWRKVGSRGYLRWTGIPRGMASGRCAGLRPSTPQTGLRGRQQNWKRGRSPSECFSRPRPKLSGILHEGFVPERYFLSCIGASGILRRALRKRRTLPDVAVAALRTMAGHSPIDAASSGGERRISSVPMNSICLADEDGASTGSHDASSGNRRDAVRGGAERIDVVARTDDAVFIHANKGRPNGRRSAHVEIATIKSLVETLTTDCHSRSPVAIPFDWRDLEPLAFSSKDHGQDIGIVSPTLRAAPHDASHANSGSHVAVVLPDTGRTTFPEARASRSGMAHPGDRASADAVRVSRAARLSRPTIWTAS